jgi:serine/threonine-protein kinase RsbW
MRSTDEPLKPFGRTILDMSIPSRLGLKTAMVLRVLRELAGAGCLPSAEDHWAELALDEALTNAIVHGNRSDPAKQVHVTAFADDARWGAIIRDQGRGFRPHEAARADTPETVLAETGRGIMLMDSYADDLVYSRQGNAVMLVRHRQVEPELEERAAQAAAPTPGGPPASARREGDVAVVRVAAQRASQENVSTIAGVVQSAAEAAGGLVLDLSGVGLVTSVFLALLVSTHKRLSARGAPFVVAGVQPTVREVLAAVALDRVLELAEEPDAAVADLQRRLSAG